MVEVLRAAAFDGLAARYDAEFSGRLAARLLREAVWTAVKPFVRGGMTVLDLGCGTGEDAIWFARMGCCVLAIDGSPAMLRELRRKAAAAGVDSWIETARYNLDELPDLGTAFDLVFSNFGALNCVSELSVLRRIAVRPGGLVALNVMGRFCAWETLWYGLRLRRTALRRWSGSASAKIAGRTIDVHYRTVSEIAAALGPGFPRRTVHGIGIVLPPSELFHLIEQRPRLMAHLARWEAMLSSQPLLASLADHRLVLLQREGESA